MRFGITSLRSLIVSLAVVVVVALTPEAAAAPTLYGTGHAGPDTESTLYRIHPLTGAATAVGAIGFDDVVIDFHPSGTLYGVGKRRGPSVWVLLEIDQATGLGTEIGTLDNTLQTTGGGYYDVSFRKDGTLFLIAKSQVNPNGLFTVDLATGVATEIGDTLTAGSGNALGFTLTDTLRHADNAGGGTLYTVDQVTGASGGPTVALTYTGFPALSGGEKLNAMDVNPDSGVAFVSVNDGSVGSGPNYLATLDPATGTVTHVAVSVNGLDGLAWQPSACVVTLYGAAKAGGPGGASTLYRFNVTDATTVTVGPIGFNRVGAMDFHPVNGLLYATAERPSDRTAVLIRINPVTGQGHEVGPLVNTKHQGGHFDLSFRHSDHTLFLMAFDPASTDVNCIVNLFTVDVDTGLATVIGDTMTCDLGNALGFIRDDTLLHLVTEQIGGNPTLYTVDPLTGVSTSTSLLTLLGFPLLVGPPRPNAMDTNPDNGITYVSINDSQSGGAGPNYLGILDPATGNVNNIGSTVVGLDALALRTDCTDYDVCTNDTCLQCEAAGIPCHRSCQLFGAVHDGRDGPSTLYRIDAATGAGTEIGPIGFERVGALDFDASGTLYGIAEIDAGGMNPDIPVLIHVDPITGAGTEVGGLVTTQMGGGHFDLSFRHFDGVLHLMATDSSNAVTVYTVDTATGFAISILGDTTVAGGGNAMAFSPGDALYHASTDLNTFAATLYEVDQFTGISGSPTVLNFLGFAPALAEPRLNSMDYNPCTGVAFTSISNRLVGGGNDNYLATLDPSTGDVTHVGPTVPGLDGLAFYSTEAVCCHVPRTGPVDFMHTVVPRSGTTMDWGGPENVVVVKGDLSALSTYVTTSTTPLPMAMSYTDVAVPAVGTGFYYLVKGDCPVASWSSGGAGECAGPGTPCLPGERDGNLP